MSNNKETQTDKAIAWGQKSEEVKDPMGRMLIIESMSVLDQARLYKAIGSNDSGNEAFVRIATLAAMIRSIDGIKYPMSRTPSEVEASISRMGDASQFTVMLVWSKWVGDANDRYEEVRSSFQDDVKN